MYCFAPFFDYLSCFAIECTVLQSNNIEIAIQASYYHLTSKSIAKITVFDSLHMKQPQIQ